MRIEELKNQYVKMSDRSITCKDENGKTKGIVTNADEIQARASDEIYISKSAIMDEFFR